MFLSARASQAVCLGYIGVVVWLVHHFARPASFFAETTPNAVLAQLQSALPFEQTAQASSEAVGPWTDRFVRPSAAARRADLLSTAQTDTGGRRDYAVALAPIHNERILPALIGGFAAAEPADAPALPSSLRGDAEASNSLALLAESNAGATAPGSDATLEPLGDWGATYTASQDGTRSEAPIASSARGLQPGSGSKTEYRVQRGDTLRTIARKVYGNSDAQTMDRLLGANPRLKRNPNRLKVGQVLVLPGSGRPTGHDGMTSASAAG